jgi:hypothetical protein
MAEVVDQAPLVLGVIIATLAVGGIFVFARILTRSVIKPQFGWDDSLILITWVCCSDCPRAPWEHDVS